MFKLANTPTGSQHGLNERIRLSDYVEGLESIVSTCLQPGSGFTMGIFLVGNNRRFGVYLGGREAHDEDLAGGLLVLSAGMVNATSLGENSAESA